MSSFFRNDDLLEKFCRLFLYFEDRIFENLLIAIIILLIFYNSLYNKQGKVSLINMLSTDSNHLF